MKKTKKRIRNVIILLLVLAVLGGGVTVGVRYFLKNSGQSVEVYPVSQLNGADWINYSNDSVYGTVVSDVSQQVYVPEDKVIKDVYVTQGDEVKIGDKLLSYDTTLLELDLELQELTVQEIELEIESAEADLKKLRNTTPVEKSADEENELLGPDVSLPGGLDIGDDEEARMIPAENMLLASADTAQGSVDAQQVEVTAQPETTAQTENAVQPEATVQSEDAAQPETTVQSENAAQTEDMAQTETTAQPENSAQTEGAAGNSDEEQLITEAGDYMNINDALSGGAAGGMSSDTDAEKDEGSETERPKLNQSLEKLLSHVRIMEPGEEGEKLLADTRDEGDTPVNAQLSQDTVKLVPHFKETAETHFERLNTYTMAIRGITLKEDKSGVLYGTANIDGNDYPEIGGYTLIRDEEMPDVAHLTIAFDDRLNDQHEIAPELADMYAQISLSAEEITGDVLVFRTAKEDTDIRITVSRPAEETETEEASETDIPEQPTEEISEEETAEPMTEGTSETGITEPETESLSETETETETETESDAVPQNVVFDVTWYHGTNNEAKWPHSLDINFYEKTDEAQENSVWYQRVSGSMEPEEEPDTEDAVGDEEPAEDTELLPEDETNGEDDGSGVVQEEETDHNSYSSVHWVTEPLAWNAALNPQEYGMVVRPKDSLNYIPRVAWGRTDENGTKTCVITMTYLEPDDSPLAKLEPLEELDFWTGENGLYYKGSGTKDDPYVFFCIDGARIESSFVNWVLGFNEDGTERLRNADGTERTGYFVRLEIRESDTITGAFIKSIGLDGTIRMEYGYGPGTYWIFSSDTGIVRYEEEVPEDDPGFDPGWDDPGWIDTGDTYTAEELAAAIAEKEREIRKLGVSKREAELKLKDYQKDMDESTVVSSVDGYVKSIGEGVNDSDAYMVVASEGGLYLRTTVSEVNLDNVERGDILEGSSWETMSQFTATITEISYFPDTSSDSYAYYGSSNPNSSSYPVLARIEDGSGVSVSEMVEVKYQSKDSDKSEIYLSSPYIRSENGQSYVYKVGEDGLLKKQYVHTGVTSNGYVEIKSGLSTEDSVAFPYGKNVKDGAKVKSEDEDSFSGYGVG